MTFSGRLIVASLTLAAVHAQGRSYTFNPVLVSGGGAETDLSVFSQGSQLPGMYPVDILLNGTLIDSRSVMFTLMHDKDGRQELVPSLTRQVLSGYGVRMKHFRVSDNEHRTGNFDLSQIPGAKTDFHFNEQSLHISIPQIYLKPGFKGIAPRKLWDDGIPAFIMNYQAGADQSFMRGHSGNTNHYSWLQLSPGVNVGAWRLRNFTSWQKTEGKPGHWQVINTYLERGISDMNSRLTLGERFTSSEIFGSVPFRGVMLASDDRMVPSSQYMFAPVIRGVARTQARVEIKQNGYTIYNQIVAPGPFALTDFNSTGAGGDFQVTVWEADGASQVFTVPFQTPAIAVKEGYLRYSMIAGQYRPSDRNVLRTPVLESTAMYGLPYGVTLYGGIQAANHYQSLSTGAGLNMGSWGALSTDLTLSRGQLSGQNTVNGQSWRMRYSKEITATNTSLSLFNVRFNQADYLSLGETLDSWKMNKTSGSDVIRNRRKSSMGVSVSQGLGKWGYLNAGADHTTFWNSSRHKTRFNAGYSVPIKDMSLSLNWFANQKPNCHGMNHIISLWLSVPLKKWTGVDARASYRYTQPSSGNTNHSAGLYGNAFDQRLSWSVDQRYNREEGGSRNNGDVSLGWTGTYGNISGSYSYDRDYQQRSIGIDGGLIAHRHGLTFTQTLGETNALIEAKGASGVKVQGFSGVNTDYQGYTAQPYLSPYHENTLSLDPTSLSNDAEITITDRKFVPTAGAVIPVKFRTSIGAKAIITLLGPDGIEVPFGSLVQVNSASGSEGIVNRDGKVYLSGLPPEGQLIVRSKIRSLKCPYHLIKNEKAHGLNFLTVKCK
ncbi:fimbria/pilus outer membrane usher protein [Enterobacteriaceae bacterium EKM102V]|uniref:fimbria/pilus outer membrane usher protein n=1 Tax=Pantoea TaxID=53335 RepID=UPI00142E84BB|nr:MULTISPECIES: fimbria/pilus outer membrane usher protein [Pantoea]KAF6660223.1 fimbria/pilus outer membrane usher protein [Enterobacteriaceae bacterium EKM102V]KAF6669938.1 fimbria/pilus outer membrane usher protein [Pantoea sp. EKM103V]